MSPRRIVKTNGICCSFLLTLKWLFSLNKSLSYRVTFQYSQTRARPAGFFIVRPKPVQNVNAYDALTCLMLTWPTPLCWAASGVRDAKISAVLRNLIKWWFHYPNDDAYSLGRKEHHTVTFPLFSWHEWSASSTTRISLLDDNVIVHNPKSWFCVNLLFKVEIIVIFHWTGGLWGHLVDSINASPSLSWWGIPKGWCNLYDTGELLFN